MTFEPTGRYARAIPVWLPRDDGVGMNRRVFVVPLWFLTGWMVAAMAAFVLGLPAWIAPLTAASVALLVALDPAGWFWARPETASAGRSVRPPAVGRLSND